MLRGGALEARRIDAPNGRVRIALVSTVALLLAGDDVCVEVVVGAGVDLEIVEIAGTVAHDMRGGSARWTVDVRVEDDGFLAWSGLPFVVADGADVSRSTAIALAPGSRAVIRETYVFGRTGEKGGDLRAATVAALDGRPLLVEDLDLRRERRTERAVLGGARCLDSVTVLGSRMWSGQPRSLQLEGPGSIDRRLLGAVHASDLDRQYRLAMSDARSLDTQVGMSRSSDTRPAAAIRVTPN
jgi:urease accessory protein